MISYGRHTIDAKDTKAVCGVLSGDWLTQGPRVAEFEKRFAAYCGAKFAVAVSSGTAALHLACLAAGLKKGQTALTSPITFLATPNSVLYAGARPVFSDIRASDLNLDESLLGSKITRRTKALMPVHMAGVSCRMKEIHAIAKRNNLVVIEDACHAVGGSYQNEKVGSCRYSDMSVFSFHPVKSMTTGEGGIITTNSSEFYQHLQDLRSHGIRRGHRRRFFKEPWMYEMAALGFNYRITDFQCALGLEQLKKLDGFIAARRKIAEFYMDALQKEDHLEIPQKDYLKESGWHLFIVKFTGLRAGQKRRLAYEQFLRQGIGVQVHYVPVYWQPYYRKLGYRKGLCPVAERAYRRVLSVPIYPLLKLDAARRVVKILKSLPRLFIKNDVE